MCARARQAAPVSRYASRWPERGSASRIKKGGPGLPTRIRRQARQVSPQGPGCASRAIAQPRAMVMRQRWQPLDDTAKHTGHAITASPVLRRPPLDVRKCRVMVAIRIYDSAARNLIRTDDADPAALTHVGRITDSVFPGKCKPARRLLIALRFFATTCVAVQHPGQPRVQRMRPSKLRFGRILPRKPLGRMHLFGCDLQQLTQHRQRNLHLGVAGLHCHP
ncbi:hypothetical protein CFBP8129_10710 [Xanthomonas hortorum pv. gardneri]|uniref:Uncharacterized protein n=1 Tax=Xanthomonas hortorum pv. gardneri TaxID=2754056 RepID=A0A6V7C9N0_9XANT|nr:hypothetical protein CFBP8129_10710 [Xanthomonas hortorum pv. gardneri]CAD0312292.1 hypothetical protein CFBP2044_11080 [Xanthomonas hortorum pv. cynarae]CAD0348621.1 hypothetical protein NCPPB940_34010 [Xanthomonas hortorum pv. taraxaci]CAH2709547.1 hypothetical protein NCPPB1935_17535 [Xanthomonas campestris pv. nigromaculans]CAD0311595.1 hypothetical protein CFBP8129_10710 [Xanthomonas hortorum pv. gardneri]